MANGVCRGGAMAAIVVHDVKGQNLFVLQRHGTVKVSRFLSKNCVAGGSHKNRLHKDQ